MPATSSEATRRAVLRGVGVGLGTLALPAIAAPAAAAEPVDLADWFAATDNVTGLTDARGESTVRVTVGAPANGGAYGFAPAALRVDPGTTVVFEWSGQGGVHNVAATDGSFTSDYHDAAGATFEWTAAAGVHTYVCEPHAAMGMKGALVVGGMAVSLGGTPAAERPADLPTFDGWLDGTDNYVEVADLRGQETVTVEVGAAGNGGDFAFSPPAVHVSPGTTVVWEWVGDKPYDVVDPVLGYASETVAGAGHRFGLTFGGDGLSRYECDAYGELGMRGVVLVGEGPVQDLTPMGEATGATVTALLGAPLLLALRNHVRTTTGGE